MKGIYMPKTRLTLEERKQIGQRIRYFRERKQFEQGEFGKMIGVTEASVRSYETGRVELSLSVLRDCATALGVPIGAIWPECDDGTSNDILADIIERCDALEQACREFVDLCKRWDQTKANRLRLKLGSLNLDA